MRTWKLSPAQKHLALRRYRTGERTARIARDLGVTPNAIRHLAYSRSLYRRKHGSSG
jgi:transposase-like protein